MHWRADLREMPRQALNHPVGRQLVSGLRWLPGPHLLCDRGARQVELPFDQLHSHQPMVTALGLSDFRQFGVEPLFAEAVGRLDPPAVDNRLVPLPGGDDLLRLAVVGQVPMGFGGPLPLGVNPRAEQFDGNKSALLAQTQAAPQLQPDVTVLGIVKAQFFIRRPPGLLVFAAEVGAEDRVAAAQ